MGISDHWYKNAIIYNLDVEKFMDSDGDGVGDFIGLTRRLDYLAGIGVTCIWLAPFYPSPNLDNGYDVTDYYNVSSRLGVLGDFVEFTREAQERGIRVIIDLVINHTSDQHPWFQAARKDKNSKYRDYYVWSKEKPENAEEGVIFPGVQESIWSYDEAAGEYYLHRFYEHQPDLNFANPIVREEVYKVMGFWLALGVSGFRVDAVPFVIEVTGQEEQGDNKDPFYYLSEMHRFLTVRRGDAMMLAEANVEPDKAPQYFGDGDKMHMMFNFWVNQHLFLALAKQEAAPLAQALNDLPDKPEWCAWANFLRNHDELDLGSLSDADRQLVFDAFAPEERMQLYDRGVRRRLPPMLEGDQRRIRLAYSLMFSLPGTPVMRYGDEIGMGDDLSLPERESVRTPMQWSSMRNAGFSTAPEDQLEQSVISEGEYGYERVNVADQQRDPDSLLNVIERMMRTRRDTPEFGWGHYRVLKTNSPSVLAHCCEWKGQSVIAIHNLSGDHCSVTLDISDKEGTRLVDLLGDHRYEALNGDSHTIELECYGFRWFRIDGMQTSHVEGGVL